MHFFYTVLINVTLEYFLISDRAIHPSYSLSERKLVYICPLPLEAPSHLPPFPTPLGGHRAPGLSSQHHIANSHWLSVLQPMPDLCSPSNTAFEHSMAEANTILWGDCPPIKKKKKENKRKETWQFSTLDFPHKL